MFSFTTFILNVLVLLVTFVFLISGICKVSPVLHPETFYLVEENFRSKLVPAITNYLISKDIKNIEIDAFYFKTYVGYIELFSVLLIWLGRRGSQLSGLLLTITMIGAACIHILVNEDPMYPASLAIICFIIFLISTSTIKSNPKQTSQTKKTK